MESYSKTHDLVLWTGSPLLSSPAPTYSTEDGCWTAHIGRPDGSVRTIQPKHIVLATGTLGPANMPSVPGAESFTGTTLHASQFHSGAAYKDKRVVVVGGANTAADVCEDLYCAGAASVTMVQRSETCVCLAGELKFFYDAIFPAGVAPELADFRLAGVPTRTRERLILGLREERARQGLNPDVVPGDEDKLEGLKKAGFLLNHGPGNKGIIWRIFERFGGMSLFCRLSMLRKNAEDVVRDI
jgi:cation diffusion facilitator CzcD-associated flavoprotein CzcO